MSLQSTIDKLSRDPKSIFLLDGNGAILSVVFLGIILPSLQSFIGMPIRSLYFLAAIPVFFAFYDFYLYFRTPKNWKPFLRAIAYANLIYCIISIGMVINHFPELTYLGITYFLLEIIIILIIVYIELKASASS